MRSAIWRPSNERARLSTCDNDNDDDNDDDDNRDDDNGDNNDYVSGSVSAVLPPSLLVFCTVIYIQLSVVLFFVIYLGNKHPPLRWSCFFVIYLGNKHPPLDGLVFFVIYLGNKHPPLDGLVFCNLFRQQTSPSRWSCFL